MKVVSINLRDEQINMINDMKEKNQIMNKSEFFRRLFDQEVYKMITLYERLGILKKMEIYNEIQ